MESIELPEPLPNVSTMNVICYDFVPQLLSILQNKKMMSANNLGLDPHNPLAMYNTHDDRLGEDDDVSLSHDSDDYEFGLALALCLEVVRR